MKILLIGAGAIVCLILTILKFRIGKKKKTINFNAAKIKSRKFLFLKGKENLIINEILNKLFNNAPANYSLTIDFNKLKNSGLFDGRCVYKIYVDKLDIESTKQLFVLNKLCKELNFNAVALCKEVQIQNSICQKFNNLKCLNLNEINPKLLFELNKININYNSKNQKCEEGIFIDNNKVDNYFLKNLRLESKCVLQDCDVECYKLLDVKNQQSIFSSLDFDINQLIEIKNVKNKSILLNMTFNKELKNEFANLTKKDNCLTINYFNGEIEKLYFSNNNFQFCIKKYEKRAFLSIIFEKIKILSNSYLLMSIYSNEQKIDNLKNLLAQNYINLSKIFDINFYCEYKKLNILMNEKLKEIYCRHYFQIDKDKPVSYDKLERVEQIIKLPNQKIFSFCFAKFFIEKFLGIKQLNGFLKILPKSDIKSFSFKINFNKKIYNIKYEKNKQHFVRFGGLEFVNLDNVNLKYIYENDITFCG